MLKTTKLNHSTGLDYADAKLDLQNLNLHSAHGGEEEKDLPERDFL